MGSLYQVHLFFALLRFFMRPIISICIPVYNGEQYLRESLDSVIDQTYKELEILLIDDCSSDQSMAIAKEYQSRDTRIRIVENEQNLGLVGNWNRCIEMATGDWVKFQFQDDVMDPETIEKMIRMATENSLRLVLTDRMYVAESDLKSRIVRNYDKVKKLSDYVFETRVVSAKEMIRITNKDVFKYNFLGEPILGLIRKDVFDFYGVFDKRLKQIVDFEFWLRISTNEPVGFINEKLHSFRVHASSQTAKNRNAKGINPGIHDRVILIDMIMNDSFYGSYRKFTSEEIDVSLEDYFDNELSKLACAIGFFRYKKAYGPKLPKSLTRRTTRMYKALRKDLILTIQGNSL